MPKTVAIPLAEPILGHGGPINQVVLREPTFDEFMSHGEPVVLTQAPNGALFTVENTEVIAAYLKACLVEPKDPLLLETGGFKLARALKEAILGFFRAAPSAGAPSSTSPTNSSSNASSTQEPSAV